MLHHMCEKKTTNGVVMVSKVLMGFLYRIGAGMESP
jgi:hypothetical protein